MKRQTGYYWVKDDEKDSDFTEIDENKIIREGKK